MSLEVHAINGLLLSLVGRLASNRGESSRSAERSTGGGSRQSTREVRSSGSAERDGLEAVEDEGIVELSNREDGSSVDADVAEGGKRTDEVKADVREAVEVREVLTSGDTSGERNEGSVPSPAVRQAAQRRGSLLDVRVQMPSSQGRRGGVVDVLSGAETNIEGLTGPFHLLEEDVVVGLVDTGDLDAVHADEREADALDEDVVTMEYLVAQLWLKNSCRQGFTLTVVLLPVVSRLNSFDDVEVES